MDPPCFRCLLLLHATIPRGLSVVFPSLNIRIAVIFLHLKDKAINRDFGLEEMKCESYVCKRDGLLFDKMHIALSIVSE